MPSSSNNRPAPLPGESTSDILRFVETIADGIIFLDRDWRITYANEAARRISRIEPQHLNAASHWELYPDTVGTPQETAYRRSMEERISLELELYYAPFDVWITLSTLPIPSGLAVIYREITRLKTAEAARDANARRLQQVFDVTTDSIVLIDRNWTIRYLNRRAGEMLAASGPVLGKNHWDCFPDCVFEGSPYEFHYRRAMDEGIPGYFEAYYPEPLNAWFAIEARPADDGIIIFSRDITHLRKAAEEHQLKREAAERQAAEIDAVYRTAPIGLALFDTADFRYLRLNDRQASFFGLKPEDVVGRTLTEMAPIAGLAELFQQVLAGTPVVNYPLEGELISHPGEHRYWTVNYFPVYAPDGSAQAISAASLEITQQKRAESALIQSEKLAAVGRLAASISHEINNPLESVTNLLYLLSQEKTLPAASREYVDLAEAELARVSQIVTQTLRFYRQSVRPSPVTAAQIVQPALDLYQGRLANSGITVIRHFHSETPILCLENELRQVVSNLISNAMDAMRTGGRLYLRAHDATDYATGTRGLRITIADTGHGMSPATLSRIFEAFFTTKDLNGTGLGLWISADIVQRHKGRMTVRSSQHPRYHGTVFSLFLPFV